MKPVFGIDIDGTVTSPSALLPFINKYFKVNLSLSDVTDYDLSKLVSIASNEFWSWFCQNEKNMYKEVEIANGVSTVLNGWVNRYDMYYISARGVSYLNVTLDWFHKHEIPYHNIELLGLQSKVASIQKNGVNLFFEDKYETAIEVSEECRIPVILFDTPYNQGSTPKEIIRVRNWEEARTWVESNF
ncbi:hypothetical protein COF68_05525 [Bacillus toyonensis]|uniref:5' nucleotidase, NT5C type n=1 Tax=Bacillus toyonensis TaxID=155322 RepID=UPI000BFC7C6D|nr:hypothetical protein [Bacillus toyonensis]PHE64303.1 hypothetical protein COF68_05525 [Bacillus toyonensis]